MEILSLKSPKVSQKASDSFFLSVNYFVDICRLVGNMTCALHGKSPAYYMRKVPCYGGGNGGISSCHGGDLLSRWLAWSIDV